MIYPDFTVPLNEIKKPLQGLQPFIADLQDQITALHPTVLSADATAVSSNSLTAPNGLSRNVVIGVAYTFKIVLWITSTAGEGLQFDLNGGTAGMTWIKAAFAGYDLPITAPGNPTSPGSLAFLAQSGTLASAVGPQDAFSGKIEIEGSFIPSGSGTFAPRIAQTAHGSGSVQVLKGSSIIVH